MQVGAFEIASWDEPRIPLADEWADEERRSRYWDWSNQAGPSLPEGGTIARVRLADGGSCVRIGNHVQADYEAFHMQHSIGYNFDHYAALGDIYSLRNADNVPQMTFLVAGNQIVHARAPANGPVTDAQYRWLLEFAAANHFDVAARDAI